MNTLSAMEMETIRKDVQERFNQLVSAINRMDVDAWTEPYSRDEFVSAFALTTYFDTRSAWVETIRSFFSARESQQLNVLSTTITPLAPDVALLTSRNTTTMRLKNGQADSFSHVFTMIWKKEQGGWKIVHSHESWATQSAK